jgi:hypothetical protein
MASIVRQKVGKYTYLYESESYRNEMGKPRNRRVMIGKIDLKTGQPVYKKEYIERMRERESGSSLQRWFQSSALRMSEGLRCFRLEWFISFGYL